MYIDDYQLNQCHRPYSIRKVGPIPYARIFRQFDPAKVPEEYKGDPRSLPPYYPEFGREPPAFPASDATPPKSAPTSGPPFAEPLYLPDFVILHQYARTEGNFQTLRNNFRVFWDLLFVPEGLRIVLSIDLHKVANGGKKNATHPPQAEKAALFAILRHPAFLCYLNSFIGKGSQNLIDQAYTFRENVVREFWGLGQYDITPGNPPGPSPDNLHLNIVHHRTTLGAPQTGKPWSMKHFGSFVHIDDSAEICLDCLVNGVLPYQVWPPNQQGRVTILQIPEPLRSGFGTRHTTSSGLADAWRQILDNFERGSLVKKIDFCRLLGPPVGFKVELLPPGFNPAEREGVESYSVPQRAHPND